MSKKTTRQTKRSAPATEFGMMAEAERRIAEAVQMRATKLDLFYLGLTEVPDTLGELQQLQELNLGVNNLGKVPAVLSELRELRVLDLWSNELRTGRGMERRD